jgi:Protein of unknown function (DUF3154).
MPIPAIIGGLLSLAPTIVDCFTGDDSKDDSLVNKVLDVAQELTGTRDPKSAEDILKQDPQLLVTFETRCKEIELEFFREETKRLEAVNRTMQTEAESTDPWTRRWRPFWGFASALSWSLLVCAIAYDIAFGDGKVMKEVSNIPDTVFLIPLTILGVASWHRGKKQRIEAGEAAGPMAKLYDKYFGGSR